MGARRRSGPTRKQDITQHGGRLLMKARWQRYQRRSRQTMVPEVYLW